MSARSPGASQAARPTPASMGQAAIAEPRPTARRLDSSPPPAADTREQRTELVVGLSRAPCHRFCNQCSNHEHQAILPITLPRFGLPRLRVGGFRRLAGD